MHEWALAEAVVASALEAAKENRLRTLRKIVVQIGELQQVEREVFEYALKEVLPTDVEELKGTYFQIETEPAILRCRACATEWSFRDALGALDGEQAEAIHFIPELAHTYLRCPRCGSRDFDVARGRGVSIRAIEGDRD